MNKITKNDNQRYIPTIDSLRAIAVLAVIFYHSDISKTISGGFIGVDIFFVISGYVISKSIYQHETKGFITYLSDFYSRRVRRIIPALVICLLTTILLSTLLIPSSWLSSTIDQTGLSAFFGMSNFSLIMNHDPYFSPKVEFIPFLHTWSLAVEEQFYLIFPILFYPWVKYNSKQSKFKTISWLILILFTIFSFCFSIFETSSYPDRAFYLLPSRFWELAAGSILFQIHSRQLLIPKSKITVNITSLLGICFMCLALLFADKRLFPYPWAIMPVIASILLLSAMNYNKSNTITQNLFKFPLFTYIGKISYSLYLWHWPVAVLFRWTVGFNSYYEKISYFIISFAIAIFSYHCIETPFRKNKYILKQKNRRTISFALVSILISFFVAKQITDMKSDISLSVTKNSFIWRSRKYRQDIKNITQINEPKLNGKQIFVLGDSHTAAYRTMLNITAKYFGLKIHEYEQGGCGIANMLLPLAKINDSKSFYKQAYSEIKKLANPGDTVFLASLRMPEIFGEDDDEALINNYYSSQSINNRQLALEDADTIISDFEKLNLNIIVDAPKPVLKSQPYRCSDWFNKTNPAGRLGLSIKKSFLNKFRQPILDSLNKLKMLHPKLSIWDPFPILCPGNDFNALDNDKLPILFDSDHLSAHGNRLLVPSFMSKLKEIYHVNQ